MTVNKKTLREYQTHDGRVPYLDWLHSLRDGTTRAVIRNRVDRFEETGNPGKCEPVGQGVSELKIYFGPGYRVYFGQDGALVILLCGGDKSTQEKDIKKAHECWADYWRRKNATK